MVQTLRKFFTALLAVMLFLSSTGIEPVYAETIDVSVTGLPAGISLDICKVAYKVFGYGEQAVPGSSVPLTSGKLTIPEPSPWFSDPDGYRYALSYNGQSVSSGAKITYNSQDYLISIDTSESGKLKVGFKEFTIEPGTPITTEGILGKAAAFGIVANTGKFVGHLESNFAIGKLVGNTGNQQAPKNGGGKIGDVILAEMDSGITKLEYFDNGNSGSGIFYTTQEVKDKMDPKTLRDFTINTDYTVEELKTMVSNMVDAVDTNSQKLANEKNQLPATAVITYNQSTQKYVIDLSSYPKGTYYIEFEDGDYAKYFTKVNADTMQITLRSDGSQKVVFNVPDKDVSLPQQFVINGIGSQSDNSTFASEQLVFNYPNATTANSIAKVAGTYLLPHAVLDADAACNGQVVTDTIYQIGGDEWHFLLPDFPDYVPDVVTPSTEVKLKVTKAVSGTYTGTDDFTFTLSEATGNDTSGYTMPSNKSESIKKDDTATFDAIKFTKAGTYYFNITESNGTISGMSFDTADKWAKVTVTGTSTLSASVKYGTSKNACSDDSLTVTNTVAAPKGTLKITKAVTGYSGTDKTYKFQVMNSAGEWVKDDGTTSNKKVEYSIDDGDTKTFSNLPADTYEIIEDKNDANRTNYSLTVSGDGDVEVKSGETKEVTVTNAYTPKSGSITLGVTKAVTGNTYSDNEDFTFTLSDGNGTGKPGYTMPTADLVKSIKNGATATFGAITFSEIGKYYFKIKETGGSTPGMTYDTADKYAEVVVTENADGKTLDASVKYGEADDSCTDSSLTITNTYSKITYTPEVTKVVTGTGVPSETYNFTLTDKSSDKSGESGVTTTASRTDAGVVQFGEITYTKPGTYEYEIGETGGSTPGMTYSSKPVTITVTVSKDSTTGALSTKATVTGGDTTNHEIENKYEKPAGSATLSVKKEVVGNTYTGTEDFKFTLSDANDAGKTGYTMPTTGLVQTAADGATATFDAITFDAVGTYYFKIQETAGTTDEITYDTTAKYATVKVTNSSDGKSLVAAVTYGEAKDGTDSSLTIKNKYSKTTYTPSITKVVTGTGAPSEKYQFTLKDESTDKTGESGVTTTGERTGAGTVSFGEITYTKAGTYKYVISETKGSTAGMTYSSKPVTITVTVDEDTTTGKLTATPALSGGDTTANAIENKYEKPTTTAKLSVTKEVTGNSYSGNEEFEFTLASANGTTATGFTLPTDLSVKAKDSATATFDEITFDTAGTYYFTITETAGSTDEIEYDTVAKYATVKVSADNNGNLSTAVTYGKAKDGTDSSLTVKNKYSKITYTPKVVKVVDGADAPSETYNFTLTDKSSDKSGESGVTTTASVTGAGTATFGEITYTKPGTYEYEIGETGGSTDGMTYSTSKVTIKVTVSKDATTGALSTKETVTGGDTTANEIKNVYVKPDGSATLSVKKEVIGNTYDGTEDFTFTLADANTAKTGYTMPTTNLVKTVNDGNAVSFGAITFDAEGTYYFTITESSGTTSEMTYDTTPKYATVKVTKSDDGKSLNTTVTYGSAKDGTDSSLTVQNKYSKTTYTPSIEKVVTGTGAPSEKYQFNFKRRKY